jgi:predicted permease
MSVTHPSQVFSSSHKELLAGHDQLKPFLLAVAIFVACVATSLAFIGLPQ